MAERNTETPVRTAKSEASASPPEAFFRLVRGQALLLRALDARLREHYGLTINEYEVLLKLRQHEEGQMRRVDLAGELLLTQGGITRLLAGLEQRGLVERRACETDRRVSYARITTKGTKAFEPAREDHLAEIERRFGSHFTSAELDQLASLLSRIGDPGDAESAEC